MQLCVMMHASLLALAAASAPSREWTFSEHKRETHDLSGLTSVTYRSNAIPMLPGQVVQTDPRNTPMKFPQGKYQIKQVHFFVTDDDDKAVPLSELYLHHMVVHNGRGNAGPCSYKDVEQVGQMLSGLSYIFGTGAEAYGVTENLEGDFGIFVDGKEEWGGNFHFIHTNTTKEGGNVNNVKKCIECECECDPLPKLEVDIGLGSVVCCGDGAFCPGIDKKIDTKHMVPKNFYLLYNVTYAPITPTSRPLQTHVMTVPNCAIDWNPRAACHPWVVQDVLPLPGDGCSWTQEVPKDQNTGVHYPSDFVLTPDYETLEESWPVTEDGLLVWAYAHQHIGAVHMQLWHERNPANYPQEVAKDQEQGGFVPTQLICDSVPTYGNGTLKEHGNEKGYINGISTCSFKDGWLLKKGDTLRVLTKYHTRPKYNGVMSYMNMLISPTPNGERCETDPKCMDTHIFPPLANKKRRPGPLHEEMTKNKPSPHGPLGLGCNWAVPTQPITRMPTRLPTPGPSPRMEEDTLQGSGVVKVLVAKQRLLEEQLQQAQARLTNCSAR